MTIFSAFVFTSATLRLCVEMVLSFRVLVLAYLFI